MLKVAQYAAQLEDYEKAIQIYEQVMKFDWSIEFTVTVAHVIWFGFYRWPVHVWTVHC